MYVSQQCFTREKVCKENFTREVHYEMPVKIIPHKPANYTKRSSSKQLLEHTHYMKRQINHNFWQWVAHDE